MAWPDEVQYAKDSNGNVVGLNNVLGSFNGLAASLGFVAGADNTSAFAAYRTYLNTTPRAKQLPLYLDAGTYYADYIVLAASFDMQAVNGITLGIDVPTPKIIGKGTFQTFIKANIGSAEAFIYTARGQIHDLHIEDLSIVGVGSSNPKQIGLLLKATYDPAVSSGGVTGFVRKNVRIYGFDGEQFISKGGSVSSLLVNQGFEFSGTFNEDTRVAGNHRNTASFIGQHGQIVNSGLYAANGKSLLNNAGANIHIGVDYDWSSPTSPTSIAANIFNYTGAYNLKTGRPVRAVTTASGALPAELAKGQTYYTIRVSSYKLSLNSTSEAQAGNTTGTPMTISTIGTAPWHLVSNWATAINTTTNILTLANNSMLSDGDGIMPLGLNLPTGLVSGTVYFWKPVTGHLKQGYLYDTSANALIGGATGLVSFVDTGTLSDYGFRAAGVDGNNSSSPINIDFGYVSSTYAEVGIGYYFSGVTKQTSMSIKPYFEQVQNAVDVVGGVIVNVDGGELANSANNGGANEKASVFNVDNNGRIIVNDSPRIWGTTVNLTKSSTLPVVFTSPIFGLGYTTGNAITNPNTEASLALLTNNTEIDIGNYQWFAVNAGTNVINYIKSRLVPGSTITVRGWTASGNHIDFASGGNIHLGGKSLLRLRVISSSIAQSATFKLSSPFLNVWELVSVSNDWDTQTQSIAFAGSMPTQNCDLGLDVTVAAVTANITAWANPTNMVVGDILTLRLVKDATANLYTIVNPTAFKGIAIPTTPATASVKYTGKWQWDGTSWMQISTTGWV